LGGWRNSIESPKRLGRAHLVIPWEVANRLAVSSQAHLDNIKAKTGNAPEDFCILAANAGVHRPGMKASERVAWLKRNFDFGLGNSMAIWKAFTDKGCVHASSKKQ
jgi:hypothetical protein